MLLNTSQNSRGQNHMPALRHKVALMIRQLDAVRVPHPFPRFLRKWVGIRCHCFLAGSIMLGLGGLSLPAFLLAQSVPSPAPEDNGFIFQPLESGRALPGTPPSSHASTLVELKSGDVMAAWFAGTRESAPDVAIYGARLHQGAWTAPVELARAKGVPCWNPVLFHTRTAASGSTTSSGKSRTSGPARVRVATTKAKPGARKSVSPKESSAPSRTNPSSSKVASSSADPPLNPMAPLLLCGLHGSSAPSTTAGPGPNSAP